MYAIMMGVFYLRCSGPELQREIFNYVDIVFHLFRKRVVDANVRDDIIAAIALMKKFGKKKGLEGKFDLQAFSTIKAADSSDGKFY